MLTISSESELAAVAAALIPRNQWSLFATRSALTCFGRVDPGLIGTVRCRILAGEDPLGEMFCSLRPTTVRRHSGATYTPQPIVRAMVDWAVNHGHHPARIIDPGCGSGRFLTAAAAAFPKAQLVGIDLDPLAALLLRANAAVLGFADRLRVLIADYRSITLPPIAGRTLFIGNPPYVRHHHIAPEWKRWFSRAALQCGISASQLAGLHIHFFLKTRELAAPGDFGAFVTSAEWLDVNYGAVLRKLLCDGLGGIAVHVLDPKVRPFADALTTGAVTCFCIGDARPSMALRTITSLDNFRLTGGEGFVARRTLKTAPRWSVFVREGARFEPGMIELGELFRVHRGQVTGGNELWIAGPHAAGLPDSVLFPAVTRARELIAAGHALTHTTHLRRVIDLPRDLTCSSDGEREKIMRFLRFASSRGADRSYIARHRRPWWTVGLRAPAPILCTYMARRAPAFVRNRCAARHLNIAHGLYPRESLTDSLLDSVCRYLTANVGEEGGRMYAGGLVKFEPREVERLHIPRPEGLESGAA